MKSQTRFKQADLIRALKGAQAAGMRVGRIEIDPNGKIVLLREVGSSSYQNNEWDADL